MYAERRRAFEARISELLNDHRKAKPKWNPSASEWMDLTARILSALEDAYQMGLGEFQENHRRKIDTAPEDEKD